MATRRVLVVEDEADVRKTLMDILRAMRYAEPLEIEGVPDGREGLDAVVRQRPDLVLLDLQMPRMDGLALLKQIREIEPRLPVIVISGTEENKMSSEALRHGAVAYLPKPFDSRYVQMLVATFLDSTKPRPSKPA
jgi:DNA-binding NtrC family response regulator